ncbi:MAG: murein biosynthesis integral membrane protein MurJ, partial [Chloroflexota bacterium]|nr:murein biosynthesis integral membrane protein MurJ [Chloroflexota bacterium]
GSHLARGDTDRAWRLASSLLTYALIVLAAAGLLIALFAGSLISRLIAPELPPETQQLAVNLTRLLLLSPLLLGLGAAGKGMLEAQDDFTLPAIAPILYNLGIIAGAVVLAPLFGIYGLAIGVILGAAGHAGIQFARLVRGGFQFRPTLSRQVEGLGEVARLMGPRIAGQTAAQANLIVMTNFASRLGEGRISALNYAQHLALLPHGLLAMSLSTVIFPLMARQYELGQLEDLKRTLRRALGPLIFLTLPAVVSLIAFRTSIVQVVFQYGSFSPESTALVAEAVGFFALGLLARSVTEALSRAFYAMHDTRTPLLAGLLAIGVNIGLSWLLAPQLGHGGLALSISITAILRMVALMAVLDRRTGGFGSVLTPSLPRMLLATAAMALAAVAIADLVEHATDPAGGRTLWTYGALALALAATGAVYVAVARALGIPELTQLFNMVRRRIDPLLTRGPALPGRSRG